MRHADNIRRMRMQYHPVIPSLRTQEIVHQQMGRQFGSRLDRLLRYDIIRFPIGGDTDQGTVGKRIFRHVTHPFPGTRHIKDVPT